MWIYVEPLNLYAFTCGNFEPLCICGWNLYVELLSDHLDDLCVEPHGTGSWCQVLCRLPQTTPKLYWQDPKPLKLLGQPFERIEPCSKARSPEPQGHPKEPKKIQIIWEKKSDLAIEMKAISSASSSTPMPPRISQSPSPQLLEETTRLAPVGFWEVLYVFGLFLPLGKPGFSGFNLLPKVFARFLPLPGSETISLDLGTRECFVALFLLGKKGKTDPSFKGVSTKQFVGLTEKTHKKKQKKSRRSLRTSVNCWRPEPGRKNKRKT